MRWHLLSPGFQEGGAPQGHQGHPAGREAGRDAAGARGGGKGQGNWEEEEEGPAGRAAHSLVAYGDAAFLFGGYGGKGELRFSFWLKFPSKD